MYFTTDTVASAIQPSTDDASSDSAFDFDTVPTARVRNEPWTDAFETDEFFVFDTVVARPIEQTYYLHGDEYTFRKPERALRRAAWSVDNVPYPLTHPSDGPVRDTSDVHGFVRNPRYIEDRDEHGDALVAQLYVPTGDSDAREFIDDSQSVSIGFYNDLDWSVEEDGVDAYQTNMLVDHVAGVERGRCSIEDGCGIEADAVSELLTDDSTFDTSDAVTATSRSSTERKRQSADPWRAGQWIKWTDSGVTNHGRLLAVEGERSLVKSYDSESGSLADWPTTVPTSELESWVGPMADSCGGDTCSCGCHTTSVDGSSEDGDGQQLTHDAPDGIYVEDGSWYGIAPSETADDEPKYELNDCNDVKDAYNLRNNGDYDIERAASAHDCSDETRPWLDDSSQDDDATSGSTHSDFDTTMTDDNDSGEPSIDTDSLVAGMSLDALAESNEKVEQLRADKDDLASTVDVLEDKVETLEDENESLEADLEDYREAEKDELVDAITDLTSAWEADSLREESVDELERRKTIAEDAATSPSTPTDEETTDDEPTTDSASDDGYTVSMDHRSWADD